jgi:mannonate dehydratase
MDLMKIGLRSHDGSEDRLLFTQQIGADGASIWAAAYPEYRQRHYLTVDEVSQMRERFEKYDLELTGIGLGAECIKDQLLGLPGRDGEIENVCRTICNMGEAYKDIPSASPVLIIDQRVTYWAGRNPGYARLPLGRGGVHLTSFDYERGKDKMDAPAGQVSSEEVWSRIAYLYERIVPVAEESKIRLATHPDDPPMAYYRGVHQVLNSFEGFKRFIDLVPSPYNGLLLCLGCMQEAGEDVPEVIRYFGQRKRIFYVHFRNVVGKVPSYVEVFPHEGDGDMAANLKALKEVDYKGYLVPDHHFGLAGDDGWSSNSRSWQVGYIRGLMQALDISS